MPRPLPPERVEFFLTHVYETIGTDREERSRLERGLAAASARLREKVEQLAARAGPDTP